MGGIARRNLDDLGLPILDEVYSVSPTLSSVVAPIGSNTDGKMLRLRRQALPPQLSPMSVTLQTVSGTVASGGFDEYKFNLGPASQGCFSLLTEHGGSADFNSVLDIVEDTEYGVVLSRTLDNLGVRRPASIATSYDAREHRGPTRNPGDLAPHYFLGINNSGVSPEKGTAIWGFGGFCFFKLNGAGFGANPTFRIRVRGKTKPHPWLGIPIGEGGSYTLAYWIASRDSRFRIHYYPERPVVGDTVTFVSEQIGVSPIGPIDWDFGDGNTDPGGGLSSTNTYTSAASLTVTASAVNSGLVDFVARTQIKILNPGDSSRRNHKVYGRAR